MTKIDKFIRNNFLFILIILATLFAFYQKATIWQQKKVEIKPTVDSTKSITVRKQIK